jgi:Fe2+ or Zn2+ uptake regulation protein
MEARKVEPSISLATVYRNLRALVAEGRVRERQFLGISRFEVNQRPHAHLVCRKCGAIADVQSDVSQLVKPFRRLSKGWQAEEVDLEIRGLCPKCQPASPAGLRAPDELPT